MLNRATKIFAGAVVFGLSYVGMMAGCYLIADGFTN